jgi:hypothetical protein
VLALHPTTKLEDHNLSAVRDCLFIILAATLHIWGQFFHPQPEDAPCFIVIIILVMMIFGPKRDDVTGEWRRLHNKELNALYSSPNIIRVIKSRRLRWAGHVARMGERRRA